jgi:hypothetical protein
VRWLKRLLLALFFAFLVGIAIGTALRLRMERPVIYMGSATARFPLHVGHTRSAVLDPGHHEQQIG